MYYKVIVAICMHRHVSNLKVIIASRRVATNRGLSIVESSTRVYNYSEWPQMEKKTKESFSSHFQ